MSTQARIASRSGIGQKKQIADRMRSMFEKTYILNFDREASTYKEEEVLEAPIVFMHAKRVFLKFKTLS